MFLCDEISPRHLVQITLGQPPFKQQRAEVVVSCSLFIFLPELEAI